MIKNNYIRIINILRNKYKNKINNNKYYKDYSKMEKLILEKI